MMNTRNKTHLRVVYSIYCIDFSAASLGDYIIDELSLVVVNLIEDVDFICGDNCATNRKLSDLISAKILEQKGSNGAHKVPLVGCASHRLNLARKEMFDNDPVVAKVDKCFTAMRTLKNASKLRKKTHLRANRRNTTRWGSTRKMLKQFKRMEPIVEECHFDNDVLDSMPSVREKRVIDEIISNDAKFESVSQALQRGINHEGYVDIYTARRMFDKLVNDFPGTRNYLSKDANIVHSPVFESAACKVQGNQESQLTRQEKDSIKRFLRVSHENDEDFADESNEEHQSFADEIINECQASKRTRTSKSNYRSMKHISATSNLVERLFSRAKLIMSDHRKHMSPFHLELILFLRCNKDLWNEFTFDEMIKNGEITTTAADEELLDEDELDELYL